MKNVVDYKVKLFRLEPELSFKEKKEKKESKDMSSGSL